MNKAFPSRSRAAVAIAIFLAILTGLASRMLPGEFPRLIRKDLGDILWGTMFYLLVLLVFERCPAWIAAITAMAIVSGVEVLKLCHAGWIDAIRATRLGGLLLGRVFEWMNFLSYLAGIVGGMFLDWCMLRRRG